MGNNKQKENHNGREGCVHGLVTCVCVQCLQPKKLLGWEWNLLACFSVQFPIFPPHYSFRPSNGNNPFNLRIRIQQRLLLASGIALSLLSIKCRPLLCVLAVPPCAISIHPSCRRSLNELHSANFSIFLTRFFACAFILPFQRKSEQNGQLNFCRCE